MCKFVVVVILVDEDVMQCKNQVCREHSRYAGDVGWHDGCDFPKESRY